jgi:ankyrin repeat protein
VSSSSSSLKTHSSRERGPRRLEPPFAETARALLEGGADWTARDEGGRTPLELAVLHGKAETAAVVEEAIEAKVAAGGV